MPVLVFMDTGLSPTTPKPAPRPMDGIAVYLLIGNSQPVFVTLNSMEVVVVGEGEAFTTLRAFWI